MPSVIMSYGGYSFSPVPFVTIGKNYQKTDASIAVGTIFDVSLNGNLATISGTGGLPYTFTKIRNLREAFDRDGKYFKIECDGTVLFEGYPRIKDTIQFSESPDNWVFTCPYSLTLEFDNEPVNVNIVGSGENTNLMPPFIANVDENWAFEFDDSTSYYQLNLATGIDTNSSPIVRATHTISAVGKSHWDGPGLTGHLIQPAWKYAKDYVKSRLDPFPIGNAVAVMRSGVFNVDNKFYLPYNHFRTQTIDETVGLFSVVETFVLNDGGNVGVIEDFDIEVRSNIEDPLTTVNIQGSIQGLEIRFYGTESDDFDIPSTGTKFYNASGYFNTIKDTALIFPRAQALATDVSLNSQPFTKIIGYSPTKGQVTYSYEYNNRPSNCITGSRNESIQINDDNPSDGFSLITIMGRSQGPILQNFNTVTEFRRNVSFDVLMSPATGCSISTLLSGNNPNGQVVSILCGFENDLKNRYSRVFKERDTTFWEPKQGRYNRSVTWVAVNCDTAPAISLCSGA